MEIWLATTPLEPNKNNDAKYLKNDLSFTISVSPAIELLGVNEVRKHLRNYALALIKGKAHNSPIYYSKI